MSFVKVLYAIVINLIAIGFISYHLTKIISQLIKNPPWKLKKIRDLVMCFDIEGSGDNMIKNPILEIGIVVMEVIIRKKWFKKRKRFRILRDFNVCFKFDSNETFGRRCSEEFWFPENNPELKLKRQKLLKRIQSLGVDHKTGYTKLFNFITECHEEYGALISDKSDLKGVKYLSDCPHYDLGKISYELNKNGFSWLPHIQEYNVYQGFGVCQDDYINGYIDGYTGNPKIVKRVNTETRIRTRKLAPKKMEEHQAIFDAIKIAVKYFLIKHYKF